jgi:hypothetical protein
MALPCDSFERNSRSARQAHTASPSLRFDARLQRVRIAPFSLPFSCVMMLVMSLLSISAFATFCMASSIEKGERRSGAALATIVSVHAVA